MSLCESKLIAQKSIKFCKDYGAIAFAKACLRRLGLQYKQERDFKNHGVTPSSGLSLIKNSPYWDESWYLSTYEDVKQTHIDPAMHYLRYGRFRNPGPLFNSGEYLLLYPKVVINPLLHYEKEGWKKKLSVSLADFKNPKFLDGTETVSRVFRSRSSFNKHIVTVLASFSGNGKVEDYVLYLLKGLREVSDYIVIVCDNPIFPAEAVKLEAVCDACICKRHGEYDFGSYKRGFEFFEEQGIFAPDDEFLMINDSCYGPIYSFVPVIEKLHELKKDFCGLSASREVRDHIQSFFYLLSPKVRSSETFRDFLGTIKEELSAAYVIRNYELMLTKTLSDAGFTWGALVPAGRFNKANPTKFGRTLLKEYSYPLVKIRMLQGSSIENPDEILEYIKQENPELYGIITPHLVGKRVPVPVKRKEISSVSAYTLREHYAKRVSLLREKAKTGKLKAIFLINMAGTFSAQDLMEKMLKDDLFEVELYVIPDIRFSDEEMARHLKETYLELSGKYSFLKFATELGENGQITKYHDVIKGADLVFYPSPCDLSYSLYNPYYAALNHILSVHINGESRDEKNDRFVYQLFNYNNFWKVFMGSEAALEEYRKYGRCEACNAEVAVNYPRSADDILEKLRATFVG